MSILKNCLYKSSFAVTIIDPKTDQTKSILVFFWNLPSNIEKIIKSSNFKNGASELKSYFGPKYKKILHIEKKGALLGGDVDQEGDIFDIDFENVQESDIKNYDNKLEDVVLKKVNYVFNISIYPEDSFWTLKQKIYVVTNIPVYRQHIYYGNHKTPYTILIQDVEYPIMKTKDTMPILNIKVDQNMNFNKDNVRIRMEETCMILDDIMDEPFYMYDLDDYFENINKTALLNDKISSDIIYHSMIKKYFPILDDKMFKKYLENEQELIASYHLINIGKDVLKSRFASEMKILDKVYNKSAKFHDKYCDSGIDIEIVEVEIKTLPNERDTMEIRNLVDLIQTNDVYIALDAYVSHNRSKYRVVKNWVGLEQIVLDQIMKTKEDYFGQDFLAVYFSIDMDVHSIYFYTDGSYTVKCNFYKTHDVNFQKLLAKIYPFVRPILDIINSNKDYLFCSVPDLVPKNITLSKIHAKIKWPKILNDKQFAELSNILDKYYTAGIISKRNVTAKPNTYMIKLVKGMYKNNVRLYLKKGVESADYYVVFKDIKTYETWNSRWGGENVEIINNMANITFEVYGMDNVKFIRAVNYIFGIMDEIEKNIKDHQLTKKESVAKTSKTNKKKFKEIDPKLYDMEDEKGTKYARICQKKHRPINIYTKEEYDSLPGNDKKHTYEFINYTTGEKVYYKCSDKMPFLGFIIGKHPDGYCIPKCKKSDTSGIKNKQVWNMCTNKHTVDKSEIVTKTHNDNILKFGKILDEDKVGFCHDSLYSIFKLDREQLLLSGIEKIFDNVNGGQLLDVLAYLLDFEPKMLIESINSKIDKSTWMGLLSANMEFEEFKLMLDDIKNDKIVNKIDITDIVVELSSVLFGLHIVLFDTHIIQEAELLNKSNSSLYMKYTNLTKFNAESKEYMNYAMICEIYDSYYPILFYENEEEIKIFNTEEKLGKKLSQIMRKINILSSDPYRMFEYGQLSKILKVAKKYIWNKYILYIESDDGMIVSCLNSVNTKDDIPEVNTFLDIKKLQNSSKVALEFIKKYVPEPPTFIEYSDKIIGCRVGQIFFWFMAEDHVNIEKYYKDFSVEYMICNPADVNMSISKNLAPTQKYKKDLYPLYYDMYIYKLFRCEFYKLMMKYRDLASHNKIVDKFKAGELQSYLQNNPDDFQYSANKIIRIIKQEPEPDKVLKQEIFIEDIIKLRDSIISKPVEFLEKICQQFVTIVDKIDEYPIDNVLYSHISFVETKFSTDDWVVKVKENDYKSLFYENGRIKVLGNIYKDLVKMLDQDLKNYDMFRYDILNFKLMFVINYLNFRNYNGEKIIIQSL